MIAITTTEGGRLYEEKNHISNNGARGRGGMRPSRSDRRKLRAAARKLRFEKRREKLAARNRMPKYIFCFACAGAGLACFAACVSIIMQLYADYKYRTGASRLELPAVTGPCYVRIVINYQGSVPERIRLSDGGADIPMSDIDITDDPGSKTLTIGYDTAVPSGSYALEVWPGDNFELVYETRLEPSYEYMRYMADAYRGPDGDLWLSVACSFERVPEPVPFSIKGRGDRYAPMLVEAALDQNVKYELNLSELARRKDVDMDRVDMLDIAFRADGAAFGLSPRGEDVEIRPSEWPACDPGTARAYSLADTDRLAPAP